MTVGSHDPRKVGTPVPVPLAAGLTVAAAKVLFEQSASVSARALADKLASRFGLRPANQAELMSALPHELEKQPSLMTELREFLLHIGAFDPLSSSDFKETRAAIRGDVSELVDGALKAHSDLRESHDVPLLTQPGWIPASPLPLHPERVRLRRVLSRSDGSLEPARSRLRELGYWPVISGKPMRTYHEAISLFEAPKWHNGVSYRLMKVAPEADTVKLFFDDDPYGYFDMMDTGEPLAFEAAWQTNQGLPIGGRYRSWLADPFDFAVRCAIPGVNVLTVRRSQRGSTFYLHQRTNVGLSAGVVNVVPAGEFQPAGDFARSLEDDFDIVHVITREYAEELCGVSEAQDPHGQPIDYSRDPRYAPIYRALTSGRTKVRYLGIGLYPLTWKPEILVVCIFDSATFDRLFKKYLTAGGDDVKNAEGPFRRAPQPPRSWLRSHRDDTFGGWRFTEETVRYWRDNSETLPAGRACLGLAWRHRFELGLDVGA